MSSKTFSSNGKKKKALITFSFIWHKFASLLKQFCCHWH